MVVRWCITPKAMTSGLESKRPMSCGEKIQMISETAPAMPEEQRMPVRMPFFTRSGRPAPRFWLTNVVSAMLKQVTGRNAKPSMRECAPQPAMAAAPNALMLA